MVWKFGKLSVFWSLWLENLENWVCVDGSGYRIWKIECALTFLVAEFGKLAVFCGAMVPNLEN